MPPPRRPNVRLPLSIGLTSLGSLVIGMLFLPAGIAGLAALVAVSVAVGVLGDVSFAALAFFGALVLGGGFAIWQAWKLRPSDAIIDPEGMRIDGGSLHGWSIAWREVDLERTQLAEEKSDGKLIGYILSVATKGAKTPTVVTKAYAPADMESLREIHALVVERASPPQKEAAVDGGTLHCAACGAIVAPADRDSVECRHCARPVPVPSDVRERIQAASRLDQAERSGDALVLRLLDQPGGRSTTALLGASFVFIGGAWPIAAAMAVHLYDQQALSIGAGVAIFFLPFLLIADGFFLSRLRLVDRHALAVLTFGFGARPGAEPGDPLACRVCGGPLPDAGESAVVRCAFCSAVNLTSVDVVSRARRAGGAVTSLREALGERERLRSRWRARTVASLPLFVVTGALLWGLLTGQR